jgi:propionyl-CoA carboxylase beta chain
MAAMDEKFEVLQAAQQEQAGSETPPACEPVRTKGPLAFSAVPQPDPAPRRAREGGDAAPGERRRQSRNGCPLEDLEHRLRRARQGGGTQRLAQQRQAGKLDVRQRLELLLDPGSFTELDAFVVHQCRNFDMDRQRIPGDGVVTGHGTIDGRSVFVFAQDFTVFGGSLGGAHAAKICKIMDIAMRNGSPVIGLCDSGGARIQEGVASLAGYADIFLRNTLASGVVPQISAILGPAAGGAVYSPALTDFVFMVDGISSMFVTGPDVVRVVTHEEVDRDKLGGAATHSTESGVTHFRLPDERTCLLLIRELLGFLPSNNLEEAPRRTTRDPWNRENPELIDVVPADPSKPYDIRRIIRSVADDGYFLEVQESYARNLVIGFIRIEGRSTGVVANQPMHLAGCLDINASVKGARFVRFCDAFNVPLLTLVDVPGFLPGVQQEWGGIIRHGAKLVYAFAEATVPKITLITRKAYGGAYNVMNSKHVRADINLAYPRAEIAVMGAEAAVNIIHRRALQEAADSAARRAELIEDYRRTFSNPYKAAELGYIDRVIHPRRTRLEIATALRIPGNKRDTNPPKKHGNIPL